MWEEIRLTLAEVRRRTPSAERAWGPRGMTPRLTVRGTTASAPPPPPPAIHCLTALGQWAVEPLQCTASLPWGQWAVELLQYTAALPSGSRQCNSCNALPHCLGAVDSGIPAMLYPTAWGQWAVELLQCIASVPSGSRRSTPAMRSLTA